MISLKKELATLVAKITSIEVEDIFSLMTEPPKSELGDIALPCFKLAKMKGVSVPEFVNMLAEKMLEPNSDSNVVERVFVQGPYLNIYFNKSKVFSSYKKYFSELNKNDFKLPKKDKTVVIDYSSPNIAKPIAFHHIRSTVIGNIIGNIFETAGYKVVRINYLGDWGTQFGKLITAFEKYGDNKKLEQDGIMHLLEIYVKYHDNEAEHEGLAKAWFKRMEDGDKQALEYWQKFKDISLQEFNRVYKRLGVTFTNIEGESFYNGKTDELVSKLSKQGLVVESDGAIIVDMAEFNMPPVLLKKNDGATLYATRDLAGAIDRYERFGFDESLYVVGNQQELHFRQIFKVLELMGFEWSKKCNHIQFGLLHLKDTKMSTRSGNVIFLEDVLDKSVKLAMDEIEQKNPDLENKKIVAEAIGVGAIIFGDVVKRRNQDIAFSWEEILNFDGETCPYVQYSHARACSLLNKAGYKSSTHLDSLYEPSSAEFELIKHIYSYDDKIIEAKKEYEPFIIARYVLDLAKLFNRYYYSERIIDIEDTAIKNNKLFIVDSVRETIKQCLNVLGITAPERM